MTVSTLNRSHRAPLAGVRGGESRSRGPRRRTGDDRGHSVEPAMTLFDGTGGELTLDDVLAGAWEGLTAHSVVLCPVCGDQMAPDYGAHALPVGGTCRGCGSSLS
jgi:hypothetical protein